MNNGGESCREDFIHNISYCDFFKAMVNTSRVADL